MIDARKQKIAAPQAWEIVSQAKDITVAKGKKVVSLDPVTDMQEVILKQIMGPSGNLRAPTLRIGTTYIVGFHQELYEEKLL